MKTKYLLPNKYKKWGWIIFIPSLIMGLLLFIVRLDDRIFSYISPEIVMMDIYGNLIVGLKTLTLFDEIISTLLIISSILLAFTKEKFEDEYINKIRLESLVWSVYINYSILIITIFSIYDMEFYLVTTLNIFTMLLLFVSKFNWELYKFKKQVTDEE